MDAPVEFTSRIGTLLDRRQEPFPDSGASPPLKAAVDRGPRPIPLGQVPPRRPRAQDPQDPIEDTPMVGGGPSRVRLFGEQRLQPLPLFIGQFMSPSHALTLSSLSSLHTRPSVQSGPIPICDSPAPLPALTVVQALPIFHHLPFASPAQPATLHSSGALDHRQGGQRHTQPNPDPRGSPLGRQRLLHAHPRPTDLASRMQAPPAG